jgi:hypothetical protein
MAIEAALNERCCDLIIRPIVSSDHLLLARQEVEPRKPNRRAKLAMVSEGTVI